MGHRHTGFNMPVLGRYVVGCCRLRLSKRHPSPCNHIIPAPAHRPPCNGLTHLWTLGRRRCPSHAYRGWACPRLCPSPTCSGCTSRCAPQWTRPRWASMSRRMLKAGRSCTTAYAKQVRRGWLLRWGVDCCPAPLPHKLCWSGLVAGIGLFVDMLCRHCRTTSIVTPVTAWQPCRASVHLLMHRVCSPS